MHGHLMLNPALPGLAKEHPADGSALWETGALIAVGNPCVYFAAAAEAAAAAAAATAAAAAAAAL